MATAKTFSDRLKKPQPAPAKKEPPKKAVTPAPAKPTPTKPSTRSKPSNSTATPNKPFGSMVTPPKVTTDTAISGAEENDPTGQKNRNVSTFMSIIGGMPPETKNRYVSAFTDFLALPLDKQNSYLEALDKQAKDLVAPKIEQDRTRLGEDYTFDKEKQERLKNDLKTTFDKVVADMDFNRNRDIAKENKTAAGVMQNIGNVAFVTGVAGGGIFRRRTALARENLQDKTDDVNINYSQQRGQLDLKKSQGDAAYDSEIARLLQLNKRDVTDLDQKQLADETTMFMELFGNEVGQKGAQNAQFLEAGVGSKADFESGGTDDERRTRFGDAEKYSRMSQDEILSSKFTPEQIARYRELSQFGDVTGSFENRALFSGLSANDSVKYNVGEEELPLLQHYKDIASGKFLSSLQKKYGPTNPSK